MFALRSVAILVLGFVLATAVTAQGGNARASASGDRPVAPAAVSDAAFTDVSCPTARYCIAVGYRNGAPSVRRWNGHSWRAQPVPRRHGALSGVWCTGKSHCLAVGHRTSGTVTHVLAARWNGHRWRPVAAPDPKHSTSASLESITCRSARNCVATGSYGSNGGPRHTLAEAWDGSRWSLVGSADPRVRVTGNDLPAVSCTQSKRCVAVGTRGRGAVGSRVLVETSTSGPWHVVAMTDPGGTRADSALTGISCSRTARSLCMAVGNVNSGGDTKPLAEKWAGGTWHRGHPHSRSGDRGDQLSDVACVSSARCLAVGSASTGATLTEIWNEHGWQLSRSARVPNRYNGLQAISCTSPTRCLAVGFDETPNDSVHPLAERWNGSSWRLVHS